MKTHFGVALLTISALCYGCGDSDSTVVTNDLLAAYTPIPVENAIILEVDSTPSLAAVVRSLDRFQDGYVNTLCIPVQASADKQQLKTLVDSCHNAGINVMLHGTANDLKSNWVTDYNIDGFHVTDVSTKPVSFWQQRIDSLQAVKPLIVLAKDLGNDYQEAGFSSAQGNAFTQDLLNVIVNERPTALLDSAVAHEKTFFTTYFPAVRCAPALPEQTPNRNAAQTVAFLAAWSMPGAPCFNERDMSGYGSNLSSFLALHTNSPILQYGGISMFDDGSEDVFTGVREYQGKKIMFAINLRNRPAEYKWPLNVMGIKTEVLLGEPIERNGGQELPPYGYQFLSFENISGFDALDMRGK